MARTKLLEKGWTRPTCLPLALRIPRPRDRDRRLRRGFLPNTKALSAQFSRAVFL
jgi:hypothetical protein